MKQARTPKAAVHGRLTRFMSAGLAVVASLALSAPTCLSGSTSGSAIKPRTQAATSPNLDQILEKYTQALGGKAAIEKLTSRVIKGTVENPSTGETGSIEIYKKAPDKLMVSINLPSAGLSTRGYNGVSGWTYNPDDGPADMSPSDLAGMKLESSFYREIRLKDLFPSMALAGTAKVGDRDAYVVTAPRPDGTEKLYFDTQSGLLVRDDVPAETDGGETTVESTLEDYREVDGVKLPFTIRQTSPDFDFVIRFTEIRHNVPIDNAKFEKPKA